MPTTHIASATRRLALVSILALLLGALAPAGPTQRSEPAQAAGEFLFLTVSPDVGPPGTTVDLWGAGFSPNSPLTVGFSSEFTGVIPLGTTIADQDGMVWVNTAVPTSAQPGTAAFFVENEAVPGEAASAPFEVTGGEIGDDEPKVENCRVTITLLSVSVSSDAVSEGQLLTSTVKTSPSTRGAPGARVTVAAENLGEPGRVDLVVAEYLRPRRAFPYDQALAARITTDSGAHVSAHNLGDRETTTVKCPDTRIVQLAATQETRRLFGLVVERTIFILTYVIRVTEVDAQ